MKTSIILTVVCLSIHWNIDAQQLNPDTMKSPAILSLQALDFLWPVGDPFLFCAHHRDDYPAGNYSLGPDVSLDGRNLGEDFTLKDGFRMYHGDSVPGFPAHPHRGFETVTIVRTGIVDHSDSHGQAGRYGNGDVQWMTAGSGLQHSEMFPLLNPGGRNPLELFQVWLNLPAERKMVQPHFKMLWAEDIPVKVIRDAAGREVSIAIIAGSFHGTKAADPAPDSWAAFPENEVAIFTIDLQADATLEFEAASPGLFRCLYFYEGGELLIEGQKIPSKQAIRLRSEMPVVIQNGDRPAHLVLLQGKAVNEPVVQYGPFVMNTEDEIRKAFSDFRQTRFGGWPWPRPDMVHPRDKGRFAKHLDGREEVR
ncbi:MAG TPA: pirin family protein [Bacteroidales bacterium]|nr:pirin family protein [Bacteroidales bacterium]HSA42755.1 pirin family protein [Bacteroidales bacterium]